MFSAGNPGSTFEHELGHIVERALILKAVQTGKAASWQQAMLWNKCTMAGNILHEAANAVKKMDKAAGNTPLGINGYIARVSNYATTSRSEALAECVADYMAHGSNAHRLSIAVMAEIRKALK